MSRISDTRAKLTFLRALTPLSLHECAGWFECRSLPLHFSASDGFYLEESTWDSLVEWPSVLEQVSLLNEKIKKARTRLPKEEKHALLAEIAALVVWIQEHAPGITYDPASGCYRKKS